MRFEIQRLRRCFFGLLSCFNPLVAVENAEYDLWRWCVIQGRLVFSAIIDTWKAPTSLARLLNALSPSRFLFTASSPENPHGFQSDMPYGQ